jgi:alpha-glucosidase (family GH31 glycosyl hydrolase)
VRNHADLSSPPQELYRWAAVAEAARRALGLRYRLLPAIYSAFLLAHRHGGSVARPVFFVAPGQGGCWVVCV